MAAAFNLTAQLNLRGPTQLKPIVSKIKKELSSIKTDLNLNVSASSAKNIAAITTKLKSLSTAAVKANGDITTLNASLSTLANSFNTVQSASSASISGINNTTKSLKTSKKAISETTTEIEEFGKQSGLAIRRFAAFSTVTSVVYALTSSVSSALSEFVNFNSEIVRLSQVTGKSVSDLGEISKEIRRLSISLGVASTDLLTVSTTLAQAGLSAEDTRIALEALAKSALAPSFDDLASTTEGAIAALRQFGLQSGELESALGSINAVAAAFAVESSDLIAAIQRTGGVFASASRGVSTGTDALNEFLAIFTSVRATTRESAETIATGLRTIFTRIQRGKTIDALKEYGVTLTDLEGKFVGPFEAVKRLSEGLNRLDPRDIRFSEIVEELGGFRQIGKVIPLIQQFATAQEALKVAQKGQSSLAQDAIIAQQSLAVQFTKTRENFVALVAEIADSSTFKALTNISFTLANGLIDVGRALEPLLPLLTTFAAIKIGSGLSQYLSGFGRGLFGRGGDGPGPSGPTGPIPVPGSTGPGGAGNPKDANRTANTAALNSNTNTLTILNQSILALNQNIVNTNSLLLNRPVRGFASGGLVPGSGNSDTFRANLTPGEFVIRKSAVQAIGIENLAKMNRGGEVQRFMAGSPGGVRVPSGKGRGKKVKRGARSRFDLPQPGDKDYLAWVERIYAEYDADPSLPKIRVNGIPTPPEIAYADALITKEVFERGGSGMMLGYDAKGNEVIGKFGTPKAKKSGKLKKTPLGLLISAADMNRGDRAPAGEMKKILGGYEKDPEYLKAIGKSGGTDSTSLLNILKAPLSAFRQSGGQTSLAGAFPGKSIANIRAAIPQYIALLGSNEPQKVAKAKTAQQYFDSFVGGGTAAKPGHATHFVETINQILKTGLVKEFASGGLVQRFKKGSTGKGVPVPPKDTDTDILRSIFGNDMMDNNGNIIAPNPMVFKQGPNKGETRPRIVTANDIRKNNKNLLNSGLDITKIKQAQDALAKKSIAASEAKQALQAQALLDKQQAVTEDITRGQQGLANKIMTFGLVGLRYGSGAKGESSLGTFPVEVPPAFSSKDYQNIRGINIGTTDKPQQKFIKIITSTISSQLGEDYARQLQNMLYTGFESSVVNIAKSLSSESGLGASVSDNASLIQNSIENAGFYNVVGAGLESALNLLGTPFTAKDEDTKSIDFPTGLKSASKIFGSAFTNIPTDVTRTIGPGGKDATKFIAQIERYFKTPMGQANLALSRFAMGGSVSEEDTVPALLTPGEFVFNKKAAKRIGYGNLNRLNKADKVQGFNKGGIVGNIQRFAEGGSPQPQRGAADLVLITSLLTSALQDPIEKLAKSFADLDKSTSSFGTALSGAIKQASSLTASAAIGFSAVDVGGRTRGLGLAGAVAGGAIGGALEEGGSKALQVALDKNVASLNKFDKAIQDYTNNAYDAQLRADAAYEVEKAFESLTATFDSNAKAIDQAELYQRLGSAISDATTTTLTLITALSSLKLATQAEAATRSASAAGTAGTGIAQFIGSIAVAAPFLGKLASGLKIAGSLALKFAGGIGLFLGAIQLAYSVYRAFVPSVQKSNEELDKFADRLKQATAASNDNTVENQRFTSLILKQYRDLKNIEGITDKDRAKRIGAIKPQILGLDQRLLKDAVGINDLNLLFREQVKAALANQNIFLRMDQGISDLLGSFETGDPRLQTALKVIEEQQQKFLRTQFTAARRADNIPQAEIDAEFNRLSKTTQGLAEIQEVAAIQAGKTIERDILAKQAAIDTSNLLAKNFIRLSAISEAFSKDLEFLVNKLELSSKELDTRISIIQGEPQVNAGSQFRRNALVLNNLRSASSTEVESAIRSTISLLSRPGASPEEQQTLREMESNVRAIEALEKNIPTVLQRALDQTPQGGRDLAEQFKPIFAAAKLDEKQTEQLLRLISETAGERTRQGTPIKTFDELLQASPELANALGGVTNSAKLMQTVQESVAKSMEIVSERANQLSSALVKITDIENQRIQTLAEADLELSRIFGRETTGADLSKIIDQQLLGLTGTTEVKAITNEIEVLKSRLQTLNSTNLAGLSSARQADIVREQGELGAQLRNSYSALEILSNASNKLKNAFDDLIKKEERLFKGPEQFLADLIQNPEQTVELQRVLTLGFNTEQQIADGLRTLVPAIRAMRGEAAAQQTQQQLLQRFAALAGQQAQSRGDLQGIGITALARFFLSGFGKQAVLLPETAAVGRERDVIKTASEALQKAQEDVASVLGEEGINKTLKDFNNSLIDILPKRITAENNLIKALDEAANKRISLPEVDVIEKTKTTIQLLNKQLESISNNSKRTNIFGGPQGKPNIKITSNAPSLTPLNTQSIDLYNANEILQQARELLSKKPNDKSVRGNFTLSIENIKAFDQLLIQIDNLTQAIQEEKNRKESIDRKKSQSNPTPATRDINPKFLENNRLPPSNISQQVNNNTQQLDRSFSSFISNFEQSLLTQGEQLSTNLFQTLNSAFSQFNNPVTEFGNIATNFMFKLEEFNARGGIKGPTIPEEVTVNVVFDDTLTVQANTSNSNQTLLDDLGILVGDTIKEQLRNLRVFGRERV